MKTDLETIKPEDTRAIVMTPPLSSTLWYI